MNDRELRMIGNAAARMSSWAARDPNEIRDQGFPQQDRFVCDKSRLLAALCTRRAGKSNGLGLRFYRALAKYPGGFCPYIALTRESAKNIMWDVLQEQDAKFKIGAKFTESNLTVTVPGGGRIQLFGADMKNFIKRLKGIKTPGAGIDESQDFGDHLRALVEDVLEPATLDYADGWIALTGTAGPVPRGYFYEVTAKGMHGFSLHQWNLYQNPYLPNARSFVEALMKKKGWDDKNPTLLREYGGMDGISRWILDLAALLIRYSPDRNDYDKLPAHVRHWSYITGVDIGIKDADALGTIAWSDETPNIYLVEETINSGDGVTELAERLRANIKTYHPHKLPTDEGALGKKVAEEIRRRFHIPLHAADKSRKMETVALLNDYLRQGKFKAKRTSRFAMDSQLVQIDYEKSTQDRLVVKAGFHSDIIDAVLYAFKESPAFTYREPKKKPKPGTPEWAQAETDLMEQQAEKHFRQQQKGRIIA